jgi:hypothetical protein
VLNASRRRQDDEAGALQELIWRLMLARLRDLERERGITKSDISRMLGVPSTQVQTWFASPTNLTLRSVGRLAAALDGRLVCRLEPLNPDRSDAAFTRCGRRCRPKGDG